MTDPTPSRSRAGPPAHQKVYQILRDYVLFGELAPGQAVTIQGLVDDLGVGMTPVREALRRLTSEGALAFQGNRRIVVPRLTAGDLDQLIEARRALEPALVRRAAARISTTDIDRLTAIDDALDRSIALADLSGYLRHNHAFHTTLYGIAQAGILAALVDGLWLRFGPSLRGVLETLTDIQTPDLHKAVLRALSDGDAEAAAAAIEADLMQGMGRLRAQVARRVD